MASRRGRIVRHAGSSHPYAGGVSPRTSPVSSAVQGCALDNAAIIEVDVIQDDTAATCLAHPPPAWVVSEDSNAYSFCVRRAGLNHGDVAVRLDIQQSFHQPFRNAPSSTHTGHHSTTRPFRETPPTDGLRRDSSFSSTGTSSYTPQHGRDHHTSHSQQPSNVNFRDPQTNHLVVEEALLTIFCCRSSQEPAHHDPTGSSFNLTHQEHSTLRAWSCSKSGSTQPSAVPSSFISEGSSSRTSSDASSFKSVQHEMSESGCPLCHWNEREWRFVRRFHLPPDAAVERTTAEMQQDVLRVQVPRLNSLSDTCRQATGSCRTGWRQTGLDEQWRCREQDHCGSSGFNEEDIVRGEYRGTEGTQWSSVSGVLCCSLHGGGKGGSSNCSSSGSEGNLEASWLQWPVAVVQETGVVDEQPHLPTFRDMWAGGVDSGIRTSRISGKQHESFSQQSLRDALQSFGSGNVNKTTAGDQHQSMKPMSPDVWHTQETSTEEMENGSTPHHLDEIMDWTFSNINAPA